MIDDVRIVRRKDERRQPLPPQPGLVFGRTAERDLLKGRPGAAPCLSYSAAANRAVETGRIDDIRIGRIDGVIRAFAARSALKGRGRDPIPPPAQIHRPPEAAVILHRAVDLERRGHVVIDVEELADGTGC